MSCCSKRCKLVTYKFKSPYIHRSTVKMKNESVSCFFSFLSSLWSSLIFYLSSTSSILILNLFFPARLSRERWCSRSALVAHSVFILRLVFSVLCFRAQCSFRAERSFVAQCLVLSVHSVFETPFSVLIQCLLYNTYFSFWSCSALLHMSGRVAQTANYMSRSQDVTIAPMKTEPKSKRFSLIDKEVR